MKPASRLRLQRSNVVIFMMDTQGSRNMSCYGYPLRTTPNIDQIASEGAIYLNHFVTSPWTLPAHASLFTGRYESGHGAGAQHEALEPGLPQMGDVFTRNGYRTLALCNNTWAYESGEKARYSPGTGFEEHIRYNQPEYKPVPPYVPSDDPDFKDKGSLKAIGLAAQWIDQNIAGGNQPFLMFINCLEPHDPYRPPEPFRSQFLNGRPYQSPPEKWQAFATSGVVCPTFDDWTYQRMLYDASTATLDDRIGKLTQELIARGLYDNTIFIVTGDHGDVIGEQVNYAYHSQNGVWDYTCKTPLIIRYPKMFKPGTRCKELVQINDIFPTLLELCGIEDAEASASIQGHSLVAALKKPTRQFALLEAQRSIHPMRRTWCESPAEMAELLDVRFANVSYKAARTKRYKYVWVSNGQDMLFDTIKDPDERWNVIHLFPEIARKLRKALETKLMSIEQRYFPDFFKPNKDKTIHNPYGIRRLCAWGLYQPVGTIAPWNPAEMEVGTPGNGHSAIKKPSAPIKVLRRKKNVSI